MFDFPPLSGTQPYKSRIQQCADPLSDAQLVSKVVWSKRATSESVILPQSAYHNNSNTPTKYLAVEPQSIWRWVLRYSIRLQYANNPSSKIVFLCKGRATVWSWHEARRVLQCSHDYQQLPLLNVHQLQHLHRNSGLRLDRVLKFDPSCPSFEYPSFGPDSTLLSTCSLRTRVKPCKKSIS